MGADFAHLANMSKTPTKKKSCFQITSVIQAQVTGNIIADDNESNDDLDEPQAEDVSAEALDVSRTDLGVCDRSSSEDAVDHTGDDHNGPLAVNGLLPVKGIGTGGRNTPLNLGGSLPVSAASQPIVSTPTSQSSSVSNSGAPTNCSSRFRVIKLDHGTGEPFRRGRWACTEFYEKDSDSNRTVDSMKTSVAHDHNIDSGTGALGNSIAPPRTFPAQSVENTDSGYQKAHPVSLPSSEPLQHTYSLAPKIGSVASAFQPTGYSNAKVQQGHDNAQSAILQNFIPNSLNGVHQGAILQKYPMMPSVTQPQQFAYSNGVPPGPQDYPHHFGSSTHSFPAASQPTVLTSTAASTAAGPGAQSFQAEGSEGALIPGLHPETLVARAATPVSQTSGRMGITASSPVTITSQSVPATVPSISATTGRASPPEGQQQNTRPKADALPLSIASVVPAVKPLITEGLSMPTPAVSFFGIPIPVDGFDR